MSHVGHIMRLCSEMLYELLTRLEFLKYLLVTISMSQVIKNRVEMV